ncbi:ABC transporter ATP-binding protein [Clostridium fallax]|uniref:Peptide/nickel transport system ATP-binding protein n=1 Tax=Clostridium fallax TaxID=1533 RepID=A0A1M4Y861_9CLOT|nr:ABC transporter ATP-binding protein [Clostridium fallax]SHF01870.1 peptide/nickel transport system ATP-binding protein [Clostridium fallax]SQB06016.1 oligopeptide transport ATP-binding protein OppD [Clostridium fallax]
MDNILEVKNLNVKIKNLDKDISILEDVSFSLKRGKITALVGESGSGKTITALSITKLLKDNFKVEGKILYEGKCISSLKEEEICKIRGKDISLIFQDPMTALNPIMTVGEQIEEVFTLHFNDMNKKDKKKKVLEVLKLVKIPNVEEVANLYPFQLSGGLRQRVMIALGICCNPKIIIADEPTTALDVTIQMEILDLLKELTLKLDATVLIITHDLGVVAEICDEVIVMYLGRIIENSDIVEFFNNNFHPYSKGLIKSNPYNIKNNRFFTIKGTVPRIDFKPLGCKFNTRCDFAMEKCKGEEPELIKIKENHFVRCWLSLKES